MEKKDAPIVKSGIPKELLKDIDAQYAIINSAVELINQLRQEPKNEQPSNKPFGEWVYNMAGLQHWLHHYTERRRLKCPCCKEESSSEGVRFVCTECLTEYEYHDEL